jgi:hypothetical protein
MIKKRSSVLPCVLAINYLINITQCPRDQTLL